MLSSINAEIQTHYCLLFPHRAYKTIEDEDLRFPLVYGEGKKVVCVCVTCVNARECVCLCLNVDVNRIYNRVYYIGKKYVYLSLIVH